MTASLAAAGRGSDGFVGIGRYVLATVIFGLAGRTKTWAQRADIAEPFNHGQKPGFGCGGDRGRGGADVGDGRSRSSFFPCVPTLCPGRKPSSSPVASHAASSLKLWLLFLALATSRRRACACGVRGLRYPPLAALTPNNPSGPSGKRYKPGRPAPFLG